MRTNTRSPCFSLTVLNARPLNGSAGSGLRLIFSLPLSLGAKPSTGGRSVGEGKIVVYRVQQKPHTVIFFIEPQCTGSDLPVSVRLHPALAESKGLETGLPSRTSSEHLIVGMPEKPLRAAPRAGGMSALSPEVPHGNFFPGCTSCAWGHALPVLVPELHGTRSTIPLNSPLLTNGNRANGRARCRIYPSSARRCRRNRLPYDRVC